MAFYEKVFRSCDCCGKTFEAEVPTFIRVPADNNLKEKIFMGEILTHKCPNCMSLNKIRYPLLYVDDVNKFIVNGNNYDSCLYEKKQLQEDYPGYQIYNAYSEYRFRECILAREFGYEPNTIEVLKYYYEKEATKLNKHNYRLFIDNSACIKIGDDGELIICLFSVTKDNNKKQKEIVVDYNFYNKMFDKTKEILLGADTSSVSRGYLAKLNTFSLKERNEELKHKYKFAFIEDEVGNITLSYVQSFNDKRFKVGDVVVAIDWDKNGNAYRTCGVINSFIYLSDIEVPYEINELPVLTYKLRSKKLDFKIDLSSTINDSYGKQTMNLFDSYLKDSNSFNYNKLFARKLILPIEVTINKESFDDYDFVNQDPFDTSVCPYVENNKGYIKVFTSKAEIKEELDANEVELSFKKIINLFLQNALNFDGIIINSDTDKLILTLDNLLNLLTNSVMTIKEKMISFLNNCNNKEIDFIGKEKYDVICKVYLQNKKPSEIMTENNLSKKDIDYFLSDGYGRIKRILRCKIFN